MREPITTAGNTKNSESENPALVYLCLNPLYQEWLKIWRVKSATVIIGNHYYYYNYYRKLLELLCEGKVWQTRKQWLRGTRLSKQSAVEIYHSGQNCWTCKPTSKLTLSSQEPSVMACSQLLLTAWYIHWSSVLPNCYVCNARWCTKWEKWGGKITSQMCILFNKAAGGRGREARYL